MEGGQIVFIDVDGVINYPVGSGNTLPAGVTLELVDGVPHAIFDGVGERLRRLGADFDLVWATGWGDRANRVFPELFGLDRLPSVGFPRMGSQHDATWKLEAIDKFAAGRPLAWIDDSFSSDCEGWARRRAKAGHPTLLVPTDREIGLRDSHVEEIMAWGSRLSIEERSGPGA